jgi:hypothetical protein
MSFSPRTRQGVEAFHRLYYDRAVLMGETLQRAYNWSPAQARSAPFRPRRARVLPPLNTGTVTDGVCPTQRPPRVAAKT